MQLGLNTDCGGHLHNGFTITQALEKLATLAMVKAPIPPVYPNLTYHDSVTPSRGMAIQRQIKISATSQLLELHILL